ncbi:methylmalonyl Co-A mutase-associated GTPase MeaB [Tropicimonas marinistellae]|uniref:methylmalonyl Co-A mutase-associated GTPase MeaB n=1 Tax=Tropicimonas marinistellae TaxID=1739787 RepID=UPI000AA9D294|nr:methylmalonyl Co-A mutase-associated GTPase MeaB [Tropicimonas marinistellae]
MAASDDPYKMDNIFEEPASYVPAAPAPRKIVGRPGVDELAEGVIAGDRSMLGRAITLIESRNPKHQKQAAELSLKLLPHAGKSYRIGITGVPGVGKSTFIEAFGCNLIEAGKKVAVLAVDPTSPITGGSILGDKTRMARLGVQDNAFIRPSPSGGSLGGVTRTTRQTLIACEAAGFDVVLVETVGAGQSEVAVSDMTDFFLVLMLPGAGDELQGIKKGVLEIADMIVVNKADADNEIRAKQAAVHYRNALHIMQQRSPNWQPPVEMCSALKNIGMDDIWARLEEYRTTLTATGEFQEKRQGQRWKAVWSALQDRLMTDLRSHPDVVAELPRISEALKTGDLTVTLATDEILSLFQGPGKD